MQNHNEQGIRQYAGFWIRFAAHMVDFIIVMIALSVIDTFMTPIVSVLEDTPLGGELLFQYTLADIIEYLLTIVYFVSMTYFTGATLGKKLLKLKVISVKGDGKLKLFDVIYRETIGRYLSDVFGGIGYLTVAFTDEKKAIHDMLCDTRVVEVRRKQAVPVRTVAAPVETSNETPDMVPKMVEEPVAQSGSPVEEHVQAQWNRILNPQREENIPPCEEQNIEGDS